MGNKYIGTKIETWFKVVYNRETHRHEKHILEVDSILQSTKGWKKGRCKRRIEIIPWNKVHPSQGYSVRFE